MKKIILLAICLVALIVNNIIAQVSYTKLKNGIEYKIFPKSGKGELIKDSTYINMHYIQSIGDSVFYSTYKQGKGPALNLIIKGNGDMNDFSPIFFQLKKGDSVQMRLNKDSIFRGNLPPFVKPSDEVILRLKIDYVYSKAQGDSIKAADAKKFAEEQAKMAKQQEEANRMAAEGIAKEDVVLKEYIATNKINAIKTPSGMYYSILEKGTGELPKNGQQLTMNYTGMLLDGTKFDSNVDPAFNHVQPFTFTLGVGQVIRGWDEGIALLPVGTKGILLIPSPMAYGPSSPSPVIKPNSIMRFDVEVISAK
jgi:FKBP-type peptidyl-prolyl cis-trans isomerase